MEDVAELCYRYGFTPLDRAYDVHKIVREPVKERFQQTRDALLAVVLLHEAAGIGAGPGYYAWEDLDVNIGSKTRHAMYT